MESRGQCNTYKYFDVIMIKGRRRSVIRRKSIRALFKVCSTKYENSDRQEIHVGATVALTWAIVQVWREKVLAEAVDDGMSIG
jgi:hypothetical protein